MKHIIQIILLYCIGNTLVAQNCAQTQAFFPKHNASGFAYNAAQQTKLNQDALEILNIKTAELCDEFGVFEFAYYRIFDYTEKGYQEDLAAMKAECNKTKKYYLLLVRKIDRNLDVEKIDVEILLPSDKKFSCLTPMQRSLIRIRVEKAISEKLIQGGKDPVLAEAVAMNILKEQILKILDCCDLIVQGKDCTLGCFTGDEVTIKLEKDGFSKQEIQNIGNYPSNYNPNYPELEDKAKLLFTVNDRNVVDIPQEYLSAVSTFKANVQNVKVIITKDDNLCESIWDDLMKIATNGFYDFVFWHHIHNNPSGEDFLFTRIFIKGGISQFKNTGERSVMPNPNPVIEKIEDETLYYATILYLADDKIKENDWKTALNDASPFIRDKITILNSNSPYKIEGLFSSRIGQEKLQRAKLQASMLIYGKAKNNPNYNLEEACEEYAQYFYAQLFDVNPNTKYVDVRKIYDAYFPVEQEKRYIKANNIIAGFIGSLALVPYGKCKGTNRYSPVLHYSLGDEDSDATSWADRYIRGNIAHYIIDSCYAKCFLIKNLAYNFIRNLCASDVPCINSSFCKNVVG